MPPLSPTLPPVPLTLSPTPAAHAFAFGHAFSHASAHASAQVIEAGADSEAEEEATAVLPCHLSGFEYRSEPIDANAEGSLYLAVSNILLQHQSANPSSTLTINDLMLVGEGDAFNLLWSSHYRPGSELSKARLLKVLPLPKMRMNTSEKLFIAPASLTAEVEALLRSKGYIYAREGSDEPRRNTKGRGLGRGRSIGRGGRSHSLGGSSARASKERPSTTRLHYFGALFKKDPGGSYHDMLEAWDAKKLSMAHNAEEAADFEASYALYLEEGAEGGDDEEGGEEGERGGNGERRLSKRRTQR